MKKEEFSVGMIVKFGAEKFGHDNMVRGVIIKINPKLARVKSLGPAGRWPEGSVWRCPYSCLVPFVGGSEVSNEMTMRSFQNPNDTAVKAWSARQKSMESVPKSLKAEDKHIMRAIHEVYQRLDDCGVRERNELSAKISLLFRAIGRDVPKDEVEVWMLERNHA